MDQQVVTEGCRGFTEAAVMGKRRRGNQHTTDAQKSQSARRRAGSTARPASGFRQRGSDRSQRTSIFYAQEDWYEPTDSEVIRLQRQEPGAGYMHPVTLDEVRQRVEQLPARFRQPIEVIQLSRMTRKRALFPCYGMQWGPSVFLYPIEDSLVETYIRPPRPEQLIEAKMFGGVWTQDGKLWRLSWTEQSLQDFYLNNVLIHEIGHVNDTRNINFDARERYANWFAIEYGYRPSRGRT